MAGSCVCGHLTVAHIEKETQGGIVSSCRMSGCGCKSYREDERSLNKMKLNELFKQLEELGLKAGHVQVQAQLGKEMELTSIQTVVVFASEGQTVGSGKEGDKDES